MELQASSLSSAAEIHIGFAEMNRLADALLRFLQEQTDIHRLNSLEFLDKLKVASL